MAKYLAYPEYKNAGIEWLDDIPRHWSVPSLKMLIDVRDGTHDTPSYVVPSKRSFPLVTSKDVTSGQLIFEHCKHISKDDYLSIIQRSKVDVGDILMPMIGTVGSPIIVKGRDNFAIKNLALFKTSINRSINTAFLNFFLQSTECNIQFSLEARGGVQNFVSLGTLRDLGFPKAPNDEQQQIANFLDHETAKIDTLIDKQQQLIKLLKEKRQAVISHAVTKGLNPNAPMKDSGVEWLGEVPVHWKVLKAKNLMGFVTSGSRGWAEYYTDSGSLFFRIANLYRDSINPKFISIQNVTPPSGSEGERSRIKLNDVLISITADLGSVCVADSSVAGGYVSQHVALCRPNDKVKDARWFGYFVLSDASKEQLLGAGYGGTKIQLSLEDIKELLCPMPPDQEQVVIANYIEAQINKFDKLISLALYQVELLQERRTALISAAVTGKIDVRNFKAGDTHVA